MKFKKGKRKKQDKPSLKVRICNSIRDSLQAISQFYRKNKKNLAIYGTAYLIITILSILLTGSEDQSLKEAPLIFLNVVPRFLTLLLCTAPAFIFCKRRTIFSLGSSLWLVWQLTAAGCRISWIFLAATAGIITAGICWSADKESPCYSYSRNFMLSMNRWLYAFTALTLVIELTHRMSLTKALGNFFTHPDIFGLNLFVILSIGSFIFLIPKRKLTLLIYSAVWLILSYGSYLKCVKVSEPILLLDVFSLGEGVTAMFNFLSFTDILFLVILIALLIMGIRILARREKGIRFQFKNLMGFVLVAITMPFVLIGISKLSYARLSKPGENTKNAFFRAGFAYSFLCSSVNSGVQMPIDYSMTAVEKVLENIDKNYVSRETEETKKPTNVIVIQLESFVDSYFFEDMSYEYDPLPFLHSLQENHSSGKVFVPVFGGQTVKSEFEFLSGLSMDSLPTGYNPYVQYLYNHPIDSLLSYMKQAGYTTTAIHNYQGEFFNRDDVYYNLGFDRFIPYETMPNVRKKTPDVIWAGDDVLKEEIAKTLEASEGGDFVFTVSVQLHGSYNAIPKEEYPMEMELKPDAKGDINQELEGQIAYYTSQMIEFDKAIQSIIEYLEQRDEPTYVLMYADHLPTLCNNLVSEENRYTTQYYTWNNMGIKKDAAEKDMELYTLSTYLCETLGMDGSVMNKFHSLYQNADETDYKTDFSYLEYYKMYEEQNILYGNSKKEASADGAAADTTPYDPTFYIVGSVLLVLICVFAVIASGRKRSIFVISSILLIIIFILGIFLLIPSKDTEKEKTPENTYKNENYVISGITPLQVSRIILSDELLIVKGDGITQNTFISISGKNYQLIYVDQQTAIYRGFDAAMDESDIIKLAILGERENTVFSETEAFPNERIEYGIETLPQNVQEKLAELEAAEASPTPSAAPTTAVLAAGTAAASPTPPAAD